MNKIALVLGVFLGFSLLGCHTGTVRYVSGVSKNPRILELRDNGTFTLDHRYAAVGEVPRPMLRGRWWRLEDELICLLPDDSAEEALFVRVPPRFAVSKNPLVGFRLSPDLRTLVPETAPTP